MELPKTLVNKAVIRFQDCDPFNHLNNGNYINYFMNHREDCLARDYQLDVYAMAKRQGISWVSGSNQIVYLRPALTMETVHIESQLINYTDSELYMEMCMYNEARTQLKSVIWSGFVHFNLAKQKREIHNEELMELFKKVHIPIKSKTFEERVREIKTKVYHTTH